VANELASKHGLFDACVCWRRRSERFEIALEVERVGEVLFNSDSAKDAKSRIRARKFASCISLGNAGDSQRSVEPPTSRIGDDRPRRIGLDGAVIELVDAPARVAMMECVLLLPPPARQLERWVSEQDRDQLLRGRGRDRDDVDLLAVGVRSAIRRIRPRLSPRFLLRLS
jgi:hypothetical protein